MNKKFPEDFEEEELPTVTVLIANYNYGHMIVEAIDSVFEQNYPKWNLVIVDDCSTDDSWGIIHKRLFKDIPHEKTDKGKRGNIGGHLVTAIQMPVNSGPSEARNVAIEATLDTSDFYMILDADDLMYPDKLKFMVGRAIMSAQIGIVYADTDILNTVTGIKTREFREPFDRNRLLQECIVHSGSMISRAALEGVKDENGYYDRKMRTCEDYDLWMRISEKFIVFHIAEPLTLVRIQPQNSSVTVDKSVWENNWQRVMAKTRMRNSA